MRSLKTWPFPSQALQCPLLPLFPTQPHPPPDVLSHLVLPAPGPVFAALQGGRQLWGIFKGRGSLTDCPLSRESMTFKKCRELENVHLPLFRWFSLWRGEFIRPGRQGGGGKRVFSPPCPKEDFATVTRDAISAKIMVMIQETSCTWTYTYTHTCTHSQWKKEYWKWVCSLDPSLGNVLEGKKTMAVNVVPAGKGHLQLSSLLISNFTMPET